MKLAELLPQFIKLVPRRKAVTFRDVTNIKKADGILFLCPKCLNAIGKREGVHSIICWQPHVPQTITPVPGRWNFIGTGYDDLTLKAGSSSILLTGDGCKAHFFITNGEIIEA